MPSVFDKLNLKAQPAIVVLGAPSSFEPEIASLSGVVVHREVGPFEFAVAFATRQAEVDRIVAELLPYADGDVVLWFAYPKGTSKTLRCDFNRDTGWAALKAAGFDTVRAVAIDADWTALRFRRVDYIKPVRTTGR